jgi:hypothetical protein
MKKKYYVLLILFIAAFPAASFAQKTAADFRLFSHMLGTWRMEGKKAIWFYEDWKQKDNATLIGKSYYLSGKDTVITEYHELVVKGDELFYMANPKNQNNHDQPVPFKLVSSENGVMVFENKAHDFPQRVVYHITPGSGKVLAWIQGDINGMAKKMEFPYTKLAD